jgi:hypothetical protein
MSLKQVVETSCNLCAFSSDSWETKEFAVPEASNAKIAVSEQGVSVNTGKSVIFVGAIVDSAWDQLRLHSSQGGRGGAWSLFSLEALAKTLKTSRWQKIWSW